MNTGFGGDTMDVERLKKINEMSKEFKKFGFSDNSLSAIKDAGKIYAESPENDIINLEQKEETQDAAAAEQSDVQSVIKEISPDYDPDALTTREIDMLKKRLTLMDQFRVEHAEQMAAMTKELADMKNNVSQLLQRLHELTREVPRTDTKEGQQELTQHAPAEEKKETTKEDAKPQGTYNQRIGTYKPEDVSIEKMFYFGNK
jgi:hypothetical protein